MFVSEYSGEDYFNLDYKLFVRHAFGNILHLTLNMTVLNIFTLYID